MRLQARTQLWEFPKFNTRKSVKQLLRTIFTIVSIAAGKIMVLCVIFTAMICLCNLFAKFFFEIEFWMRSKFFCVLFLFVGKIGDSFANDTLLLQKCTMVTGEYIRIYEFRNFETCQTLLEIQTHHGRQQVEC